MIITATAIRAAKRGVSLFFPFKKILIIIGMERNKRAKNATFILDSKNMGIKSTINIFPPITFLKSRKIVTHSRIQI